MTCRIIKLHFKDGFGGSIDLWADGSRVEALTPENLFDIGCKTLQRYTTIVATKENWGKIKLSITGALYKAELDVDYDIAARDIVTGLNRGKKVGGRLQVSPMQTSHTKVEALANRQITRADTEALTGGINI